MESRLCIDLYAMPAFAKKNEAYDFGWRHSCYLFYFIGIPDLLFYRLENIWRDPGVVI